MINQSNKVLNTNITKLVNKTYQYGFSTNIEKDIIEKALNEYEEEYECHDKGTNSHFDGHWAKKS